MKPIHQTHAQALIEKKNPLKQGLKQQDYKPEKPGWNKLKRRIH